MASKNIRAKRLVRAGEALYGSRWQTTMAAASRAAVGKDEGWSQTYVALMASGARPVTDQAQRVLKLTLQHERKRLREVSAVLADITQEMNDDEN